MSDIKTRRYKWAAGADEIRLIPMPGQEISPFLERTVHFAIPTPRGTFGAFDCPRTQGGKCSICEFYWETKDNKELDALRRTVRPQKQNFGMFYIIGRELEGFKVADFKIKMGREILENCNDLVEQDEENPYQGDQYGNDGQNIVITKKGSGMQTSYSWRAKGKRWDLSDLDIFQDELEQIQDIQEVLAPYYIEEEKVTEYLKASADVKGVDLDSFTDKIPF